MPEVEQKIVLEIFKKEKQERCLEAPSRNEVQEGEIDQNLWLKELHSQLKSKLERAIVPLGEYL